MKFPTEWKVIIQSCSSHHQPVTQICALLLMKTRLWSPIASCRWNLDLISPRFYPRSWSSSICLQHSFNGNFRILKWSYVSTIFLAIFCWDIPLHRPNIGLIYGRYLQFRFLKWSLILSIQKSQKWCFKATTSSFNRSIYFSQNLATPR